MSKRPTETPVERPLAQPTPEPIIDELKGSPAPKVGETTPPQPAELDQDPGGRVQPGPHLSTNLIDAISSPVSENLDDNKSSKPRSLRHS